VHQVYAGHHLEQLAGHVGFSSRSTLSMYSNRHAGTGP
jgi:hypothetical protein